jgi:hypothetical protein
MIMPVILIADGPLFPSQMVVGAIILAVIGLIALCCHRPAP